MFVEFYHLHLGWFCWAIISLWCQRREVKLIEQCTDLVTRSCGDDNAFALTFDDVSSHKANIRCRTWWWYHLWWLLLSSYRWVAWLFIFVDLGIVLSYLTGSDSPVNIDLSIFKPSASIIRISEGTLLPASRIIKSPTTKSEAYETMNDKRRE